MLFKTKLFRNINKIFYTLKERVLIVQNSFSLALFALFLGFLCGNLFGTFLDTLRIYFIWNGFVVFIILLFIEVINFFVYRIPLAEKIAYFPASNFLASRPVQSMERTDISDVNSFYSKGVRDVKSKVLLTVCKETKSRNTNFTSQLLTSFGRAAQKMSVLSFGREARKGRKAISNVQNSSFLFHKSIQPLFHLFTQLRKFFFERKEYEPLAFNKTIGVIDQVDRFQSLVRVTPKEAGYNIKGLRKGKGVRFVEVSKIISTIYIERSINAFKIGLLFGFFIDSFKVGS